MLLPGGAPAAGATVSILGYPGSALADREGRFVWRPDPRPPFQVLVILPDGLLTAPAWIEALPVAGPLVVRVAPAVAESVTVSADAAPGIEAPPAGAASLVTREEIAQRHALRLADVLENLPGAGRIEEGHSAVPSLRGMARGRTTILIDGARVTSERRAGASATYLDPFALERVEVSRGPGSVAYGSDAFGGVIEARTRMPSPGAPFGVRFQGSLGEGVPERAAGLELSRGFARGGLLFQARLRDFQDYAAPGGEVFNSAAEDRGVLLKATSEAGPGRLTLGWQSDRGREIGKPATDSLLTRAHYPREDSDRLTAAYDLYPVQGFTRLGLSAFLGSYALVTDRDRFATAAEPGRLERSEVRARDFGLRASAGRPAGRARVDFGLEINGRFGLEALGTVVEYDATGALLAASESPAIDAARRTDAAIHASLESPLRRGLTAAAGLRLGRVSTRNRGGQFGDRATDHGAVAGHAALTAASSRGLSATLQVARGFRDPTLSDRYFAGVSGRGRVTGNPDLGPETSRQIDLAVRYARPRWRIAGYAYRYRIDDLVERFESPPGSGEFFFRNRGAALLHGLEIELRGETPGGTSLTLGAHLAKGAARDDGSPLDDVPADGLSLVLRRALGGRAYLMARAAAYARDDDPGPTEGKTPGHATFDLGAGLRLGPTTRLRLLFRNLADREYPATADAKSVAAPGRTALLTLDLDF